MAVQHLVTKGSPSIPFLVTQGLGDYGGVTPPAPPEQPTSGGSWGYLGHRYKTPHDLRRDREDERERLEISKAQQKKIDRVAVRISREMREGGLAATAPAVMALPAFDALLAVLQPSEGQVMALAAAILDRIIWAQAVQQADEEAALLALLAEI